MVIDDPDRVIFLAGASGAIGRALCRLLIDGGWRVFGTTRSEEKARTLRAMGVEPVVVDVFDLAHLRRALSQARPRVVIHQLTDLPPGLDPSKMAQARVRNARIREVGTRNLIEAATAVGVKRMVAQSIAFAYTPGPKPYREESPLDVGAPDDAGGLSARGVASLERQVLSGPFAGIVLRYGKLYGPGTGFDAPPAGGPVHVDAAADAARRAITHGSAGIYNIAENDGTVSTAKAVRELGWDSGFRVAPGQVWQPDPALFSLLAESHARLVGVPLVPAGCGAVWLYRDAPFALVAHNTEADPRFIYANRVAQRCFEYSWSEFVGLRSRLSTEPTERAGRQQLLDAVGREGFVSDYRGIRVAKSGRRFWIEAGTIWQLVDERGAHRGQAAVFRSWRDV